MGVPLEVFLAVDINELVVVQVGENACIDERGDEQGHRRGESVGDLQVQSLRPDRHDEKQVELSHTCHTKNTVENADIPMQYSLQSICGYLWLIELCLFLKYQTKLSVS